MRLRLLFLLPLLAACAPPPEPALLQDPCTDPTYRALRDQPADSLTAQEREILREREQRCMEIRDTLDQVTAPTAPRQLPPEPLHAWTEPLEGVPGQSIRIQNVSDVPIVVTSLLLTECRNMATSCGTKRVHVTLRPGQVRTVLQVRFRQGVSDSHYSYSYQYQVADEPRREP